MGIDLGGGDICKNENELDGTEISTTFEKMGGKGMPENMGADVFINPGNERCLLHNLPEAQAGHGMRLSGDKAEIAFFPLEQIGTGIAKICRQALLGLFAKGNQPFLGTLPHHPQKTHAKIKCGNREPHQLGNPQSGGIEEMQHGVVPHRKRIRDIERIEKQVHLVKVKGKGQTFFRFGEIYESGRIVFLYPFCEQIVEKRSDCRELAGNSSFYIAVFPAMKEVISNMVALDFSGFDNIICCQVRNKGIKIVGI